MILNESIIRKAASKSIYEFSRYSHQRFDEAKYYDLFISHSFQDRELISGLRNLFEDKGYSVYVDWIDDKELNRQNVNAKTAELLKRRIRCCKGLAYIATDNIANSKWCPWELGIADGMKKKTCILPIMNSNTFTGREYLELYPYLSFGDGNHEFWVENLNDGRLRPISLGSWLKES